MPKAIALIELDFVGYDKSYSSWLRMYKTTPQIVHEKLHNGNEACAYRSLSAQLLQS